MFSVMPTPNPASRMVRNFTNVPKNGVAFTQPTNLAMFPSALPARDSDEVSVPTPASYQPVCASFFTRLLNSLLTLVGAGMPSLSWSGRLLVPSQKMTMRRPVLTVGGGGPSGGGAISKSCRPSARRVTIWRTRLTRLNVFIASQIGPMATNMA